MPPDLADDVAPSGAGELSLELKSTACEEVRETVESRDAVRGGGGGPLMFLEVLDLDCWTGVGSRDSGGVEVGVEAPVQKASARFLMALRVRRAGATSRNNSILTGEPEYIN